MADTDVLLTLNHSAIPKLFTARPALPLADTDVLLTLNHSAIPKLGETGVFADSEFGLGGGICHDTLKGGNVREMTRRLCVPYGRAELIERAIEIAEAPRPLTQEMVSRRDAMDESTSWDSYSEPNDVHRDHTRLIGKGKRRGLVLAPDTLDAEIKKLPHQAEPGRLTTVEATA